VRRAKLYYLRDRSGKSARIKEKLPIPSRLKRIARRLFDFGSDVHDPFVAFARTSIRDSSR
jgi:hypothetical protein